MLWSVSDPARLLALTFTLVFCRLVDGHEFGCCVYIPDDRRLLCISLLLFALIILMAKVLWDLSRFAGSYSQIVVTVVLNFGAQGAKNDVMYFQGVQKACV